MAEYTQEIGDQIIERLADGESLRSICRSEGMPTKANVFRWIANIPEFADQYARAREAQADSLADDIVDIADDGRNDWIEANDPENAGYRVNGENIQRSKLRVDARKWAASKLKPKAYGDKLDLNHGGAVTVNIAGDDAKL